MVKQAEQVLEVEVNTSRNANLYFGPIERVVRGRFDFHRALKHDRDMASMLTKWPEPVIPGQRLRVNLETCEAALIEPLYDPQHLPIREVIERNGQKLEPQEVTFTDVHLPTWLHWLSGAVKTGKATIVKGVLPEKIEGTPVTRFHSVAPVDPLDRLTAAMERQSDLLAQVLNKLAK